MFWSVSLWAMISPLLASTARWSLRQLRRDRAPCFSSSHCPAAYTLQSRAFDQHVQGAVRQRRVWSGGWLPFLCPTAQRRMIWDGYIKSHKIEHRIHEPFGLAQPHSEDTAQGQGAFGWQDRNTRVDHLAFFAVVQTIQPMLPASSTVLNCHADAGLPRTSANSSPCISFLRCDDDDRRCVYMALG